MSGNKNNWAFIILTRRIKTEMLQLTPCPPLLSRPHISKLHEFKWPESMSQQNSLDSNRSSVALGLRKQSNYSSLKKCRQLISNDGGDFVWFLYLIRICVWPLGEHESDITSYLSQPGQAGGRGIHNINNIRSWRSPPPRTMINIAFCFQAWGFQFLQATESEAREQKMPRVCPILTDFFSGRFIPG